MLQTSKIEYVHGEIVLEAYCALDDSFHGNRPAVMVAPDWSGRNDFACQKAEQLAELGYIGFALDMYGNGKVAATKEEKLAMMQPLLADRLLLRQRVQSAYDTVCKLDVVNPARVAVIGYCFGGLCALDLARSGAEIRGAVSVHGLLDPPTGTSSKTIHSKVLVLHGFEDPMAGPDKVLAFEHEMTKADVDWQVYMYGHAKHAFTNPKQHDVAAGLVYNSLADKRSWLAAKNFFTEIFS